ncbi:hypothetical protein, partial [Bilophila wadsworthia]
MNEAGQLLKGSPTRKCLLLVSADGENDKRQKARTLAVLVRFLPFIRDSSSNAQFSGNAVLAFCQQSHGVSVFLLVANKYSREYG